MNIQCSNASERIGILIVKKQCSLKQWREDLRKELDFEGEDEKTQEIHF